jgi:hypothetical protein
VLKDPTKECVENIREGIIFHKVSNQDFYKYVITHCECLRFRLRKGKEVGKQGSTGGFPCGPLFSESDTCKCLEVM